MRSQSRHVKATLRTPVHQACTKYWILLDHYTKFTVILILMAPGRWFSPSALRIEITVRSNELCVITFSMVKMLCRGRPVE